MDHLTSPDGRRVGARAALGALAVHRREELQSEDGLAADYADVDDHTDGRRVGARADLETLAAHRREELQSEHGLAAAYHLPTSCRKAEMDNFCKRK